MRILLLAHGTSVHTVRFIRALLTRGYHVTLVDSTNPKDDFGDSSKFSCVEYPKLLGPERLGLRTLNRLGRYLIAVRMRAVWKKARPDVVHVHWVDGRAEVCALARLRPLVLTCWGSDINNLFASEFSDDWHRQRIVRALRAADHITADSPEVLARCEALAGHSIRGSIFYFGIDFDKFRPANSEEARQARHKLGIAERARVILSVRALRPLMGHLQVLEAFANLAGDTKHSDALLAFKRYLPIADGYEDRLRARVSALGLDERVIWLEAVPNEEMPLHYAVADVIVNYPERDGFPVTFFEATACRRPVVTSWLPAYQGVFDAECFWTATPGDEAALTQALRDCLMANTEARQGKLERAWQVARLRGDEQECFRVMDTIYHGLSA